jgi:hypothetical protein
MVKQTTDGRSPDSDFETFHEGITGDQVALYRFGRSAETDCPPHEPAPLFLSGRDDEPDPREFTNLLRKRRPSLSSRILASVLVASTVAILFALFSSDEMRNIVVDPKVSIASLSTPSAPSQPGSVRLTAEDIQLLNDPARLSRPANQTPPGLRSVTTVATAPPREEIPSADQSATQSQVPAAVAPAAAATIELSDAEKKALFQQLLAWEVERNARAQVRPKKAKRRPPTVVMLSPSAGPLSTR